MISGVELALDLVDEVHMELEEPAHEAVYEHEVLDSVR
jgi:hypothetical protein